MGTVCLAQPGFPPPVRETLVELEGKQLTPGRRDSHQVTVPPPCPWMTCYAHITVYPSLTAGHTARVRELLEEMSPQAKAPEGCSGMEKKQY